MLNKTGGHRCLESEGSVLTEQQYQMIMAELKAIRAKATGTDFMVYLLLYIIIIQGCGGCG